MSFLKAHSKLEKGEKEIQRDAARFDLQAYLTQTHILKENKKKKKSHTPQQKLQVMVTPRSN